MASPQRQSGPRRTPEHRNDLRRHEGPPQTPPHPSSGSCRDVLQNLPPDSTTHAGLWLDRFLPRQDKTNTSNEAKGSIQAHIKRLNGIGVPERYLRHFERWKRHLDDLGGNARTVKATVRGRMIIGLGTESVLETAIHLHHTYGVPVIPGSALKGLAASYARNHIEDPSWHKPKDGQDFGASYRALFGDITEAGCVIFHDALWIPPDDDKDRERLALDLDVMTVHHRDYYGTKGTKPPADSDDPNPVSFVTARGTYLIALEGPPEWTDAAMTLLKRALAEEGIGAKTAAGYGRVDLAYESQAEVEQLRRKKEAEAARKARAIAAETIAQIQKDIAKLHGGNANARLPQIVERIRKLPPEERPPIAQECVRRLGHEYIAVLSNSRPWAHELLGLSGDFQ